MKAFFYFLYLPFLVGTTGITIAQPANTTEVRLWFHNNDRMRGSIMLDGSPDYITIYKTDADSLRVPINMIKKIQIMSADEKVWHEKPTLSYYNNTFIGILVGRSNSESAHRSTISAEIVNGVKIFPYLWPGVGIGFDHYPEVNTLPIYFTLRGDLLNSSVAPFYFMDLGSGPAWNSDEMNFTQTNANAGIMFHLGGGIKMYSGSHMHIMLSMGYKNQQVRFTRELWDQSEEITNRNYKNFSFRVGIGF